jgi:hypothetical protein
MSANGGTRVAASGLQRAGLLDRDQTMRDAGGDKPGGRKGTTKNRSHRTRDIDPYKDRSQQGSSRIPTVNIACVPVDRGAGGPVPGILFPR